MPLMKRIAAALSLIGLLASCNQISLPLQSVNCPARPASLPYLNIQAKQGFYDAFNYQIRDIVFNEDTITFRAPDFDFVFCRGKSNWTIQPGTFKKNPNRNFADPPYQIIQFNAKTYRYRVLLEPNSFPEREEPEQVVFELILPNQEQPTRQVLYTLAQVQQAQTGSRLGVPEVAAAVVKNDRLFWAVSPEQGEGNGGIATIVSYRPQAEQFVVMQPEEIKGQQINDLVVAGKSDHPTLWIATQLSGEGTPAIPGMGLVAYRPDAQTELRAYYVRNSPIVGAIPTQLKLEGEDLWVGTGNGICRVEWRAAEDSDWNCWRFVLQSELPKAGVPLYKSLLAQTPAINLKKDTVEVFWWLPQDYQTRQGRYEVKYDQGFTVTLADQGAQSWSEFSVREKPIWESPVVWAGWEWHWNGNRFIRGFDEVVIDFLGVGSSGISPSQRVDVNQFPNYYAIRGDLDLLTLTEEMTEVTYYSGWVNDYLLKPYLTVVPQKHPKNEKPNPLEALN